VPRRVESLWLAGPAGRLEALLEEPADREPSTAAVLCHPHPLYGGTMHNKVVYRMAHGLRRAGVVVLRFNFRGVGRSQGEHGHLEGEIEDARAALAWLNESYPELPFGMAGFSFGSQVAMRLGCSLHGARWLLAAGFPAAHGGAGYLETCRAPKIFIQSTHDQFGPRPDMEALYRRIREPKRLIWIDSIDHFFAGAQDALERNVTAAIETQP